uniref:Uncharacterized protein n=1 Tax=Erpetoichthys calabaricus TaxID=27687 RepID=A0A8C4XE85_ERPCA
MAEAKQCGVQDKFTCSVCLHTLTDPVSLHCAHSFCLTCLANYWDQKQECSCPECGENFTMRPELSQNTVLNEIIKKLKETGLGSPPSQNYAGPGDVECDFCIGKKFRAVKTCLTCPASYCQTHLQPHFEIAAWKDHKLSFADLICCIEEAQKKLGERIREQEKRETEMAEGVVVQLEKEIEELKKREDELKELSNTKDHIRTLQVRAMLHRESEQSGVCNFFSCPPNVVKMYKSLSFCFYLHLFQVSTLALTGTRCYWEVECSKRWVRIGVAYKGLSRKGKGMECGLGMNNKSWSLWCCDSQYSMCHNFKQTYISAPYSPRIGVFLDWPAGSLSFYSVSHTMTLLHRFNTSFTEPLYPGVMLWFNSSVTICPLWICSLGSE